MEVSGHQFIIVVLFLTITFVQVSSQSSKTYVVSEKKVTWSEARILCERGGQSLATVRNADEQGLLRTALKNFKAGALESYWIAATNVGCDNGEFCWLGNPLSPVNYSHWSSGGFNNGNKCVKVFNQHADWYDWDCSWNFPYVCEQNELCPE